MKLLDINTVNVVGVSLDRKAKLVRWADLVAKSKIGLGLMHNLEYYNPIQLKHAPIHDSGTNAFTIACADPVLQSAGLSPKATLPEVMTFFDITQRQLHEFSCDCGGVISTKQMAGRIAKLA
jgi:hypothetical protein